MAVSLEQIIRHRAGGRCEYCKVPDGPTLMLHVLDHVIARQHGGQTILSNLASAALAAINSRGQILQGWTLKLGCSPGFSIREMTAGTRISSIVV